MPKQDLEFIPSLQLFSQSRAQARYTVLAGPNNSGKSLTLRWLKSTLGRSAYFVGTNRFYHVYHLSTGLRQANELEQFESSFQSQFHDDSHNHEQNVLDLGRILQGLKDVRRNQLFELCGSLIGATFSLQQVEPGNDLSPRYIDMDGQNLSVGSTGTRLLMTVLGLCMDDRFSTILIDEPELGLSPKVQSALSSFFQDQVQRAKYFPHLERVFVATHSNLFLSRNDVTDNFVVTKEGRKVSIARTLTIQDFHKLQFNLLGNSLETLFFPSAVVVVEGKTDYAYLERVIGIRMAGRKVTVVPGNGDVKKKVYALKELLGDFERSPFRGRVFVVLDSVHQPGLSDELARMGVLAAHIVVWPKNGIEYYYPRSILQSVFSASLEQVEQLAIDGDRISVNGITRTKNELATEVIKQLTEATEYPVELESGLLSPLSNAVT
ncbi:ATP-dependent nuclease [Roseateles violae]|uniref:AAA family ATPase n=1 Tax=Roseateles violae TaxID=3058042 RepID=A0ABT8DJZ5_9BURK|nr:AAA family ATPase [Pelomonas sp. PFR6]MDN3918744.1 AAA family ATPase [Pelomonas sp. PFR6]